MHPYLQNEEHLLAFQHLTARPTGSVRKWEQLLGWKPGRLQRFLTVLVKEGLAEIETCHRHSVFRPLVTVAGRSVAMRSVAPPNQEQCSGLTASRFRRPPAKWEKQPGAEDLIDVVNEGLKHHASYLPIRSDNYGSHQAARRWIVDRRIPLEEAIGILTKKVNAFDLDKSEGEFPRTIGFFTKAVLAEWGRIQRDREQLKLFPKLEMHVEQSAPEYKPDSARPPASMETIDRVMQPLREQLGGK